jgi:hypothetical protein
VFFRIKTAGGYDYIQLVENRRVNGVVQQSVIASLGRADHLIASGALASLVASGAKLTGQALRTGRCRPPAVIRAASVRPGSTTVR